MSELAGFLLLAGVDVSPVEGPALPALVAAIAAVIGVVVGRFWDSKSESRRFQRTKRVECYEQQAKLYFRLREAIRALSMSTPGSSESSNAFEKVLDIGSEWNAGLASVWLHATEGVTRSLGEVDLKLNEALLKAIDGCYSWDDWRVERQPIEKSMEMFLSAVREELGSPELPVRLRTFSTETLRERSLREKA